MPPMRSQQIVHSWSCHIVRLLCLWTAIALAGCNDEKTEPKPTTELRAPAEACSSGSDCISGLCIGVADGHAICTWQCDPDQTATCPTLANWRCQKPDELEVAVCACISDSPVEVCADGLDNDCNGYADDCGVCGSELVGPDDEQHCGACFRSCVAGATCKKGECICADGSTSAACVREPGAAECTVDRDCDDSIDCTDDRCSKGQCIHAVNVARCGAGRVCDLLRGGCRAGSPCAINADCQDGDPCTAQEVCDPRLRVCMWRPLDGDGDGHAPRSCGGRDCDDSLTSTFPGAVELCDGMDNNCDGLPDSPSPVDVCGEQRSCLSGACRCNAGTTDCAGRCVDVSSDSDNCGGCGILCRGGKHCALSVCIDDNECADGSAVCPAHSYCLNASPGYTCNCDQGYVKDPISGVCKDVNECATSLNDCTFGACVNTEGAYECVCPDGYEGDGRTCTDVNECLTVNCSGHGQCENMLGSFNCICDPGYVTDFQGACLLDNECQAGLVPDHSWCNGYCASTLSDRDHCGSCWNVCIGSATCSAGSCACAAGSGQSYCPESGCRDLRNDGANCGACGTECGAGAFCLQGECFCPTGQKLCNGSCTPLTTTFNCGDCDVRCPSQASCSAAGSCECPTGLPDTCNGSCVDRRSDLSHCGRCGNTCATGASCTNGGCTCPAGQNACNGTCVSLANSPQSCGRCGNTCAVACNGSACVTASQIGAGDEFSCALLSDKAVRCWGMTNRVGTGLDSGNPVRRPVNALELANVRTLAVGEVHACAVTESAQLYCWGDNYNTGAVPVSGSARRPVLIGSGYTLVAPGANFTCAQRTDGSIVCWGASGLGQHGDGSSSTPSTTLSGPATNVLSNVDRLVAGGNHACALKSGSVYCWGSQRNEAGNYTTALTPTLVPGLAGVTDLATWSEHTCAIQSGSVYCWGLGNSGQLGNGLTSNRNLPTLVPGISTAQRLSVGDTISCAKLRDGSVTCWGTSYQGQLGNGGSLMSTTVPNSQLLRGTSFSAIALGRGHGCAVESSGGVSCWGTSSAGATTLTDGTVTPTTITW